MIILYVILGIIGTLLSLYLFFIIINLLIQITEFFKLKNQKMKQELNEQKNENPELQAKLNEWIYDASEDIWKRKTE